MSRVAAVLLLAIGARAFGPHGDGTTTYTDAGWCVSRLDTEIGAFETPELCYAQCLYIYGDDLVAIDWYPTSGPPGVNDGPPLCYCQDDCQCMSDIEGETTITRDSKVDELPEECGGHASYSYSYSY